MLPLRARVTLGAIVPRISQSSSITGTSPSDCLVLYQDTRCGWGSYPSAERQSVYSTAPSDWASYVLVCGVLAEIVSIVVDGAMTCGALLLTVWDLKAVQLKVLRSPIQVLRV